MTSRSRPDAMRPAGPPLRAVRSVAAALVCVTTAAVGHHGAGGALPVEAVATVFAGSAAVAWFLTARRVTATQLVGLLALCQIGVHFGASSDQMSSGQMSMGAAMIAAHVAATAISAVALARGERFVWELARRLGLRLRPLVNLAAVVPSVRRPAPVVTPRSLRDALLTHSLWLRGPPVGLV